MKIERMNKGSWGKVRAFFDLTTSEGFVIKGFKIIEGINGLFVSMPSQKSNDGEYYDSVFATKELRDELNKTALDNYGSNYSETLSSSNENPPMEKEKVASTVDVEKTEVTENKVEEKNEPFSEDDIPF